MTQSNDRLDRIEQILESLAQQTVQRQALVDRQLDALAANQLEERDRRLELREDLEILEQRLMQTQNQIDAIAAQLQVLTADISASQSQWTANYAAEAQSRADYQRQMLGLQQESRNILRELAQLRRQERRNGGE